MIEPTREDYVPSAVPFLSFDHGNTEDRAVVVRGINLTFNHGRCDHGVGVLRIGLQFDGPHDGTVVDVP